MSWSMRVLVVGAVLLLVTAGIVILIVIPQVRADSFALATPDRAAGAFRLNALLNVLAAATALLSVVSPARIRRVLPAMGGVVALLLGPLLIDAATALAHHGAAMRGAVVALWACVVCDLVGGAALVVASLAPRG